MTHRATIALRRLERDSHDQCSRCGRAFKEGDTAHAGFLGDLVAAYVGDCCAHELVETSARYHWTPLPYERPPGEAILWRYTDLAKFIALLKDRALYFVRADRLGDPFEGAKGSAKRKETWDSFYLEFFRSAVRNPPPGITTSFTSEEIEDKAQRLLQALEKGGLREREQTYVSCWHESEHESEALWRRYGGHGDLAIAIRTTASRLIRSLGDDPGIKIGRVKYVDMARQFVGVNEAFFRKRRSFEHEQEVRALVQIFQNPPDGGHIMPVDLGTLIESVVVSPIAPVWFADVVREVLARFGSPSELRTSELADEPFF